MNKIAQTKESIDNNTFDFSFCRFIPYKEKEEFAEKLMLSTVICDSNGICYISYKYDLIRMFLIAQYYTNIDTTNLNTDEGREQIFDYMTRYDGELLNRYEKMCCNDDFKSDIEIIDIIFNRMSNAIIKKYEYTSSLPYRIGVAFGSILGDNDIIKTQAENRSMNESLIDLIGKAMKFSENEKISDTGNNPPIQAPGLISFAKK